jgi:4-amino-4-deoxy-L-arabinose transferase-like glycosyltransferase
LIVYLIFLVARTIWGRPTALWVAAAAAVFPPFVLLSQELLSEPLFLSLELGAVLAVFAFRRSGGRLRWAVLAGLLCGVAAITRNIGLALIVPICLGLWIGRPRFGGSALAAPLTMLAFVVLAMLPWIVRNEAEFHRFIPVSSGTGFTLAGTYNPHSYADSASHGGWRTPQRLPEFEALYRGAGDLDEAEVDEKVRAKALEFAENHPGYVVDTSIWNLARMFELSGGSVVGLHGEPVRERGIGDEDPLGERIGLGLAVAFALAGIVAIWHSGRAAARDGGRRLIPRGPWFMWWIPILALVTAAPLGGLPRYRLVADPFILMLAGVGIVSVLGALRRSPAPLEATA